MNQKQDRKNLESGELAARMQENERKIIYWPPKNFYSNAQDAYNKAGYTARTQHGKPKLEKAIHNV